MKSSSTTIDNTPLKSADSLWGRLILDLNRAKDVVRHTVGQVREMVAGFRAIFSGACT